MKELTINANLTPIDHKTDKVQVNKDSRNSTVNRKQFPMVCAECLTVHKSGDTYECKRVKVEKWMSKSSMYAAFSRTKTLEGLYIV